MMVRKSEILRKTSFILLFMFSSLLTAFAAEDVVPFEKIGNVEQGPVVLTHVGKVTQKTFLSQERSSDPQLAVYLIEINDYPSYPLGTTSFILPADAFSENEEVTLVLSHTNFNEVKKVRYEGTIITEFHRHKLIEMHGSHTYYDKNMIAGKWTYRINGVQVEIDGPLWTMQSPEIISSPAIFGLDPPQGGGGYMKLLKYEDYPEGERGLRDYLYNFIKTYDGKPWPSAVTSAIDLTGHFLIEHRPVNEKSVEKLQSHFALHDQVLLLLDNVSRPVIGSWPIHTYYGNLLRYDTADHHHATIMLNISTGRLYTSTYFFSDYVSPSTGA